MWRVLKEKLTVNFLVAFLVAQGNFTAFSQKRLSTHDVDACDLLVVSKEVQNVAFIICELIFACCHFDY